MVVLVEKDKVIINVRLVSMEPYKIDLDYQTYLKIFISFSKGYVQ